jgi:molybdopterin-dependent oxidoreductase alpha subunit
MGLTQHKNGVANIQSVVNLLLLRGSLGKPGAGACPVRGHSNVQGDRTMGIWEKMGEPFLARLDQEFGFVAPRRHGLDTVETIRAMEGGRLKVFFALGGNFLSATPDTDLTGRAMAELPLVAHVSTKLHRGHLIAGKTRIILPCLGRTEVDRQATGPQFVTVENSMSVVSASVGRLPPASEQLRSEVDIVASLAAATLGGRSAVDWRGLTASYDRIREHIARVVPGFEDFNLRVRKPGGFHLPNAARERRFDTATGRARMTVHPIPRHDLSGGRLLMMTIRSHDQYNTTVYGVDDRYRGVYGGRRVILMHPDDLADRGLAPGALVDITSHFADGDRQAPRFAALPYPIPRGCAATYFPETNVLVPLGSVADRSNTPASKSVIISVRPSETPPSR